MRRLRHASLVAMLGTVICAAPWAWADRIRMKNGEELAGTVIKRTPQEVVIQFDFGTMSFAPQEIEVIPDADAPAPPVAEEPPAQPPTPAAPPVAPDVRSSARPRAAEPMAATELPQAIRAVAFIHVLDAQGKASSGTGTLINPNGVMLTNHHVVQDAAKITVTLPTEQTSRFKEPRQYDATVLKINRYYDLALVDIAAKTPHFLRFADNDAVQVGEQAKAIGNPHGLSVTVSQGIISSVRRNIDLRMQYTPIPGEYVNEREFEEITWIQTDASINPGNSGGPLLDAKHRIIGINTWIVTESGGSVGLGFALHVKHVKKFARGYSKSD